MHRKIHREYWRNVAGIILNDDDLHWYGIIDLSDRKKSTI